MNSLQLAHSLARHLRQGDLATVSASAKLDIVQAINAGLQIVWSLMPAEAKTTTITGTLRAPATVAFTIPARYSNLLTSPAFTEAQRGCTVMVGDDASPNEVAATNAILDEYLGTVLSGNAIVYGDAIPLNAVIERVVSEPAVFVAGTQWRTLVKQTENFARLPKTASGAPQRYTLIPVGGSQGADPSFFFRVWPLPDQDYKFRFDAELSASRVTFAQVTQTPASLAIPDRLAESALLPIAKWKLSDSPEWADRSTVAQIRDSATEARGQISLMAGSMAPTFNSVGTPEGW